MIKIPTNAKKISIDSHNNDIIIVSDWIEACIGFSSEELTRSDVIDTLLDEEIYIDRDFAEAFVNTIWDCLYRREKFNNCALFYKIKDNTIRRIKNWDNQIAHSFCLLLSLAPHYDTWEERNYNEQGELFERFVEESIKISFPELKVFRTGWSRNNCDSDYFRNLVNEISIRLNLKNTNIKDWEGRNKKDYGMDILTYFDFGDKKCGVPYYMMQCASGKNWNLKLSTPNINIWRDILRPDVQPVSGFAIPFCLSDETFYQSSVSVGGFFFDRTRILRAADKNPDWLSPALKNDIKNWIAPRINRIMEED